MTATIMMLAVGYGVIGIVLVLTILSTGVPVIVRALVTLLVVALMFTTYWGVGELRGLPSDGALPDHFRLHWARVVEPQKLSGEKGSIFLWVEKLDADNYPSGQPRAYQMPYSRDMAELVTAAVASIADGEEIAGEIAENAAEFDTSERLGEEIASGEQQQNNAFVGERLLLLELGDISFGALPAPLTPDKAP